MSASPTKRSMRPPSTWSLNLTSPASSRPETPRLGRRPASSMSLRSPTPSLRRPQTPMGSLSPTAAQYTGNINVSIRVKPNVLASTPTQDISSPWEIDADASCISSKDVGEFLFDNVFDGPDVRNADIYTRAVAPLVDQVMQGYNGTVFAYGMTGSGKTFSMQGTPQDAGIIPQAVLAIFNHISANSRARSFTVSLGYLEIYNEHINDLLTPQASGQDEIRLRDDVLRGVKAMGLKEVQVSSAQQLLDLIAKGDAIRRTEGTDFNTRSSRSHAVVQISVVSTPIGGQPGTNAGHNSTLYLCDLAGSERAVSQTERRKEGAYINKSLLTLGTIIARLSAGQTGHVPYRDSKLTRLLQPALSGRSLVSVLCTVQTTGYSYIETLSTLRFAARAKNIVVTAKRNDEAALASDPSAAAKTIERLLQQVAAQKLEIEQLRGSAPASGTSSRLSMGPGSLPAHQLSQLSQLEAENRILHERVEHLSRLCDDSRLDEVLGLSPEPDTDTVTKQNSQIEEYKSYISHLEKQLYQQEVQKSMSDSASETPHPAPNSSNSHFQDIIRDLQEQIDEVRETSRDKDRIIAALRSSNKRKEQLASLTNNNPMYPKLYPSGLGTLDGSASPEAKENLSREPPFRKAVEYDEDVTNLPRINV